MKIIFYISILCAFCFSLRGQSYRIPAGVMMSRSNSDFDKTYDNLKNTLNSKSDINIFEVIDHTANASKVGIDLPSVKVIIFGNPKVGTALMQNDQLAGLDLPQKILIIENEKEEVFVVYNAPAYLKSRYKMKPRSEFLKMSDFLKGVTEAVTANSIRKSEHMNLRKYEGIETYDSANSFKRTCEKLEAVIAKHPKIAMMSEVNHQKNALGSDLGLRPSRLFIFGNPKIGSQLIKENLFTGIDLPMKILVWQDEDGSTKISYSDPKHLKKRFKLKENLSLLDQISTTLIDFIAEATSK